MKTNIFEALVFDDGLDLFSRTFTGAEAGFNERADVAVQAADGTDLNAMWREINATLALRNSQRSRLIDLLTFKVTNEVETVSVPSAADFEEASEYGQPVGMRGGARFHRGYDFKFYDLAVRYTWMFLAEADRAQLESYNSMALEADNRLLFNKVMKTIFNSANLVGVADGNIPTNVYKLYNADGEVPPQYKNTVHAGSHNHYITSGGATVTSVNLDTMANHLRHHGFGVDNGTTLVLLLNSQEIATVKTFRVATGAGFDFIPSSGYGGGVFLASNAQIVARPGGEVPGEVGTYGPWHIVEEDFIPAGYMLGLAQGGAFDIRNPVGIREHKNPAYQGLKLIPGQRSDYPLIDSFYRRGFGTGIRQRGGAIVMQVTVSGSYTIPAAYV